MTVTVFAVLEPRVIYHPLLMILRFCASGVRAGFTAASKQQEFHGAVPKRNCVAIITSAGAGGYRVDFWMR